MTDLPYPASPPAVTADDVDLAVRLAAEAVRKVPAEAWAGRAGALEWDRRETADHLIDDLFAYAVQLGPKPPPLTGHVPFAFDRRPGGPALSVRADPEAGSDGIAQTLEAAGALLTAMVRTAAPTTRAHHVMGVSDAEGFAAMGVVETLAHTHDLVDGLGIAWNPPADLCARVLHRLFRNVPPGSAPWPTFLWATGRGALPGHPRQTSWRWYGEPSASKFF